MSPVSVQVEVINNNAFVYSLTGNTEPSSIEPSGIEPGGIEPGIVRRGNKVNIKNFTVNINFLGCYFNNNG